MQLRVPRGRGDERWGAQTPSSARGTTFCHETCDTCADMIREDSCRRRHWGLPWSSLWGHETCE
eukprot:7960058-Pyramimonas_sp.AAC.1